MRIAIDKCFLLFVFVFASLLQCSFVQSCPTNLQNIAVYENESAAFTRDPNDKGAATWTVIPSSKSIPQFNITDSSSNVVPALVGIYEADSTQLKILNSTIVPQGNANYSTAGLYFLKYTNPTCNTAAGLVVVKSGPVCTCVVLSPTKVNYTCSVEFANNVNQQINPIMTWINSSGIAFVDQPKPTRLDPPTVNNGRQNSTSQVTVASTDATTYECQMNFSTAFAVAPYAATNAPDFNASCFITNCAATTINPTTTAIESTTPTSTPTTKTIETTTSASTTTISDTTTTNLITTTAPLSTTAELLSTTAALTSDTTSFASTTYVATSSLPITTYSSNESEAQAVITVLAVALASISTLTLVMLSWWFCLCQTPAATALPAAKALATPRFIPRIREVNPWSFYSQKGIYDGREANPWSFYSRRGMYEGREADPWSFYSRRGMYEGRQSGRPRYESYERY